MSTKKIDVKPADKSKNEPVSSPGVSAVKTTSSVDSEINELVKNARDAYDEFLTFDQTSIDNIVKKMTISALSKHRELAKMAIDETEMGVYEDKVTKNIFASEYVYNSIKYIKTVGYCK